MGTIKSSGFTPRGFFCTLFWRLLHAYPPSTLSFNVLAPGLFIILNLTLPPLSQIRIKAHIKRLE